jgi:hypothetical protein
MREDLSPIQTDIEQGQALPCLYCLTPETQQSLDAEFGTVCFSQHIALGP